MKTLNRKLVRNVVVDSGFMPNREQKIAYIMGKLLISELLASRLLFTYGCQRFVTENKVYKEIAKSGLPVNMRDLDIKSRTVVIFGRVNSFLCDDYNEWCEKTNVFHY